MAATAYESDPRNDTIMQRANPKKRRKPKKAVQDDPDEVAGSGGV